MIDFASKQKKIGLRPESNENFHQTQFSLKKISDYIFFLSNTREKILREDDLMPNSEFPRKTVPVAWTIIEIHLNAADKMNIA